MGADLNALTMKMADPAASRMLKEGQRLLRDLCGTRAASARQRRWAHRAKRDIDMPYAGKAIFGQGCDGRGEGALIKQQRASMCLISYPMIR